MVDFKLIFIAFILCYLIGSIPSALVISRFFKGIDIRNYGSGNPGATNVFRVIGKTAGTITLILDFSKGFVPVIILKSININTLYLGICAFLTIIGHMFPVFAGFRGGKGVATGTGVAFAIFPEIAFIGTLFFLITLFLTRVVSIASLTGTSVILISVWITKKELPLCIFLTIAGILIIYRHRTNIKKLLENKINKVK